MADSGMPESPGFGPSDGSEAASAHLSIPGGDALLGAEFRQVGADLLVADGNSLAVTLPGYFDAEHLPSLVTDTGVHLDGDLVRTLTPPQNPADICQADATSAIGKVADVAGSVQVQHADGSTGQLAAGDPVFQGDVLQAGGDGKIDIVFVDGTNFSLGAGARMTLDELVFDPNGSQTNTFTATVLQGAFVFATGQIAPSGNMDVKTPVGTIGIRGTTVAGHVAVEGSESVFTLVPDPKTGHVGKVVFTNGGGTQVLDVANATTKVVSFFITPSQPVSLPAADLLQFFDQLLQQFYDSHGGTPSNFEHPDGRQGSNQTDFDQALAQLNLDNFTTAAGPDGATSTTVSGTVGFAALSPLLGFVPAAPVGFAFTTVSTSGGVGESDTFSSNVSGSSDNGPPPISQDAEQVGTQQQQQQSAPPPAYVVVTGGSGDDTLGGPTTTPQHIVGNDGSDQLTGGDAGDILDGGSGDDTLDAGLGDDQIFGGSGDDTIIGGHGQGNDHIDGGDGIDTVKYSSATIPIIVDLTQGKAFGDPAIGVDTLVNVENVVGGSGSDAITGDANANKLEGGLGDDQLTGMGGDDFLDGGDGTDTSVLSGKLSDYLIQQTAGGYTVTDYRAGGDGFDTLTNIENARFADGEAALADIANKAPAAPADTDVAANKVVENAAPGTAVGLTLLAVDANPGDGVTYSLTDDAGGLFAINAETGKVTVAGAIDYEAVASHDITVRATDKGGLFSEQTFTINVTNVDDNPVTIPTDTNAAANIVAENAAIGTAVGITANSTDADVGATVTYSLSDNPSNLFAIDATTGVVTVAGALDYENATSHNITVVATSSDSSTSTQTFTIAVTNVNDNPVTVPTDADAATNTVAGDADVGTAVGITANATDADVGATVTYSLSNDAGGLFAIDATTGVVTVASPLDGADSHSITVMATSSDGSPATSQTFTINISHENSVTTPTDTDAAANTVAEDAAIGTTVGIMASATDPDGGDTVTYSLSADAGGRFAIDATTGVVTVAGALDYETATSHDITVVATSTDGSISSQNFTIAVTNVSDNPVTTPIDTNATANTVAENAAIGTAVGITANSTDADVSAIVTYSLSDNSGGRFAINATTGVVTVAGALDYETATSHTITVQAISSDGSPSTTQTFTINVTNVGDNPLTTPTDTNATANTVAENAAIGTAVGITAHATDADVGAVVTYSLSSNPGGLFAIDATTGVVTVAGALDYETATSHNITVVATSSDGSAATTQTFTIAVTNVNDNPVTVPVDTNVTANTVAENAAVGTVVGLTAYATDADVGATVTYSLSDNAGGLFAIDATTGVVTVAGALDAETATSHDITVKATSSDGSTPTTQTFTVNVTNVNDNPVTTLTDTNNATNRVEENAAIGTAVGITAHATDADVGATVTYSLSDNAGGRFAINATTGVVTVAGALGSEDSHNITVVATSSDGSPTNSQTFAIDVNRAPATATDTDVTANTVDAAAPLGTLVGIAAHATDPDAGDTVQYTLVDDAGGRFSIGQNDGRVIVFGPLGDAADYNITVRATDQDNLSTDTVFTVSVTGGSIGNLSPELTTNTLYIAQGDTIDRVSVAELDTTDSDNTDAEIRYILTAATLGALFLAGSAAPLNAGDSFTQQDIDDGKLTYQVGGGATDDEDISVDITDGANTLTGQLIHVSVVTSGHVADGDVNVTRPLDINETLIVGHEAYGSFTVIGDSGVSVDQLIAADGDHGDATIIVEGSSANLTVSNKGIQLGSVTGQASTDIFNGGTLDITDGGKLTVTNSTVLVDGFGSNLTLTGDGNEIDVTNTPSGLTGTLSIINGASVSALTVDIGAGSGHGIVTVNGTGVDPNIPDPTPTPSSLLVQNDDSMGSGDHGHLIVGDGAGSIGQLFVQNGGMVSVQTADTTTRGPFLEAGVGASSSQGEITVDGLGSLLRVTQYPSLVSDPGAAVDDLQGPGLALGILGAGAMSVSNLAHVDVSGNEPYLGVGTGNYNDPNSAVAAPQSSLLIESGGTVFVTETLADDNVTASGGIYVGDFKSGNGKLTVTGEDSLLSLSGPQISLSVGGGGTGDLDVENAGGIILSGPRTQFSVGSNATGVGTATVTGGASSILVEDLRAATTADNNSNAVVGDSGKGTLDVLSGATFTLMGGDVYFNIGANATGDGTVKVSGTSSELEVVQPAFVTSADFGANLTVGNNGKGTLTVELGGAVSVTGGDSFIGVGQHTGSTGTLTVQSGGAVTTHSLGIGEESSGTATVTGVGSIIVLSSAYGAYADDDSTTYREDLDGSNLNIGNRSGGVGILDVLSGGVVHIADEGIGGGDDTGGAGVQIGHDDGSTGTVTVSGAGSEILMTQVGDFNDNGGPYFYVARSGTGTLNIEDQGLVELDGQAALFIVGNSQDGDGTLDIESKGALNVFGSAASFIIANFAGTKGDATVSGAGSSITVQNADTTTTGETGAHVTVGMNGIATLDINGGAVFTLSSGDAYFAVGGDSLGDGTVTVDGDKSKLDINTASTVTITDSGPNLHIGEVGKGTVTVENKGSVSVSGIDGYVAVGNNDVSTGTLNVESGGSFATLNMAIGVDGHGHATVTGTGSTMLISNDSGKYDSGSLGAGNLNVGLNATGDLSILAGASVEVRDGGAGETVNYSGAVAQLGRNAGSLGSLLLDGNGSALLVDQNGVTPGTNYNSAPALIVGRAGTGNMTISHNAVATVSGQRAFAGVGVGDLDNVGNPAAATDTSTLTINTGGKLNLNGQDAWFVVGEVAKSDGAATVNGTGSAVTLTMAKTSTDINVGAFINVGAAGKGALTVSNHGDVNVISAQSYIGVGQEAGSTGTMTVKSGGTVEALYLNVGRDGAGSVTVTDSGSKITLSNDSGYGVDDPTSTTYDESKESGYLTVGRTDAASGNVQVLAGGVIEIRDAGVSEDPTHNTSSAGMQLGRFAGSTGTVTVDGTGSKITVSQNGPSVIVGTHTMDSGINIGIEGKGDLTVSHGGLVSVVSENAYFEVGDDFDNDNNYEADARPQSTATINTGGQVTVTGHNAFFGIGDSANSDGKVTLDGAGSAIRISMPDQTDNLDDGPGLTVGGWGKGSLTVSHGALVGLTGEDTSISIGQHAEYDDDGNRLNFSDGSMTVESGGQVTSQYLAIGRDGNGVLTVTDTGSSVILSNDSGKYQVNDPSSDGYDERQEAAFMAVGRNGIGYLNVLAGAVLTLRDGGTVDDGTSGPALQLARDVGGQAHVLVDGAGSQIDLNQVGPSLTPGGPNITVGMGGQADMTISHTAKVTLTGDNAGISVGADYNDPNGNPRLLSTLNVNTGGSLEIHGIDSVLEVGNTPNGNGAVSVDGDGSQLKMWMDASATNATFGGTIGVGNNGHGTLSVTDGAHVSLTATAGFGFGIGGSENSQGEVTVDGISTSGHHSAIELTLLGDAPADGWAFSLGVGGYEANSPGTLTISNGGEVLLNDGPGYIGVGTGPGTGTVNISGAGSKLEALTVGSNLHIGFVSDGHVTVGSGGSINIGVGGDYIGGGSTIDDVHIFSFGRLDVLAGGTVKGDIQNDNVLNIDNGTVNGDVANFSGKMLAGDGTVATATINGDLQVSGDAASVTVDATGTAAHDLYAVSGNASINDGTIVFDFRGSYAPALNDKFDFLTAGGTLQASLTDVAKVAYGVNQNFKFSVGADGAHALSFTATSGAGAGSGAVYLGSEQADNFLGTSSNDAIYGGGGNDTLTDGGNSGNVGDSDLIQGGVGADTMSGGFGRTYFNNATQADNFYATVNGTVTATTGSTPIDQIQNFDATVGGNAGDKISFDHGYFTHGATSFTSGNNFSTISAEYDGSNAGTNSAFASGNQDALIMDGHGNLIYDNNGSAAGYTIVAHITDTSGQAAHVAAANIQVNA